MAIQSSDIAKELQEKMGISANASKAYVDFVFESIKKHLEENETVNICMFGKFEPVIPAPKNGRSIHTKQPTIIPAKHKIKFTMSRKLLEQYNKLNKD